jgi:CRP-like cAMP-binding protein
LRQEEQRVDLDEQCRLLGSVTILSSLPASTLKELAQRAVWRAVISGEEVIPHLNNSTHVCFVARGNFRAEMTTAYGRTIAIRKLKAPAHFGEIAALTGAPRSVRIVADSNGLVAECPAATFLELMRDNADVARAIAVSLARNVVLLTDRLFELAALEVRFRLYAELLRLAHDGAASDGGVVIFDAPTHEMIAAAIGAQREAVTRELRHLVADGVLKQGRREITIVDLERLRQMVRQRAGLTSTQLDDWQG